MVARRRSTIVVLLLSSVVCGDPSAPLDYLVVSPSAATLVVGDTLRLTATGLSVPGDTIRGLVVTWASSDTLVAAVSGAGVVTARAHGTATITAASGPISAPASIAVTVRFAAVAPGAEHDCALTAAGVAYCWGENHVGQLGDGGTTPSASPVAVVGGHRFRSLKTGGGYTCGIDLDSLAWCWGGNGGRFGNGSTDGLPHPVPLAVAGGLRFREISAHYQGACGVTGGGQAYCWGRNWFGLLGTDSPPDSIVAVPTPVAGGLALRSVSTGWSHSCGLTFAGAPYCWGANYDGELGAVTDTSFRTPTVVVDTMSLHGVAVGGEQACALDAAGATVCWGTMEIGEGYWHRRRPQRVAPGLAFTRLSTAYSEMCGLDAGGAAWCWGSNWQGEVGDGTVFTPRYPPVRVLGAHTFVDISVGDGFVCAIDAAGAAFCWGSNYAGVLGKGTAGGNDSVPVAVVGGVSFRSIAAGRVHTCGIAADSTAWCWGDNTTGQLGDSTTTNRAQPTAVRGGLKFIDLAASGFLYYGFTCGLTAGGAAYCWGDGSGGQLGSGGTVSSTMPVPVAGGLTFTRIAVAGYGRGYACGVTAAGTAYCWGDNRHGRLGRGDTVSTTTPMPAAGGLTISELTLSDSFACARAVSGAIHCWGSNWAGQMGQGFLGFESLHPLPVASGPAFTQVAVGDSHTCGLAADSTAWCWGRNSLGQLGTGDFVSSIAPRAVAGGLRFASLAVGSWQSCGRPAAGAAYCWGYGRSPVPTLVFPGSVLLTLAAGPTTKFCGVLADSTIACVNQPYGPAPLRGPSPALRPAGPGLSPDPALTRRRAPRTP